MLQILTLPPPYVRGTFVTPYSVTLPNDPRQMRVRCRMCRKKNSKIFGFFKKGSYICGVKGKEKMETIKQLLNEGFKLVDDAKHRSEELIISLMEQLGCDELKFTGKDYRRYDGLCVDTTVHYEHLWIKKIVIKHKGEHKKIVFESDNYEFFLFDMYDIKIWYPGKLLDLLYAIQERCQHILANQKRHQRLKSNNSQQINI